GENLYREAGVDITAGDAVVDWLVEGQRETPASPLGQVVSGIGGFSGLFLPNFSKFKNPMLVSSTDGVGTKLLLAIEENKLDGIGIDLVAMCVNDLYCCGATPLFFLDYFATGRLDAEQFKRVLTGIRSGLAQ